jgi:hypothetical protein
MVTRANLMSISRSDDVSYFLSRWFAYLDVVGSLSGSRHEKPLSLNYLPMENASGEEAYQIDCLLGFTGHCVSILARVAELAKQCEPDRFDENGDIRANWKPSEAIVQQAEQVRDELQRSQERDYRACTHRPSLSGSQISEHEAGWDSLEIFATNEAFHWAGLIHLLRRVLGRSRSDLEVQTAVREIVGLLYKVRKGSTAEACLLFPMFTAGVDAIDRGQRERIAERLKGVEGFGMIQVRMHNLDSMPLLTVALGQQS